MLRVILSVLPFIRAEEQGPPLLASVSLCKSSKNTQLAGCLPALTRAIALIHSVAVAHVAEEARTNAQADNRSHVWSRGSTAIHDISFLSLSFLGHVGLIPFLKTTWGGYNIQVKNIYTMWAKWVFLLMNYSILFYNTVTNIKHLCLNCIVNTEKWWINAFLGYMRLSNRIHWNNT